jgi:hypothetical protein
MLLLGRMAMASRANLQLADYLALYVADQELSHGDSDDSALQENPKPACSKGR